MSSDKEKPERPKSKMGGLGSVFRTLGRGGGKKDKNDKAPTPTGPIHGAVLGKPISMFSDVPPLARRCLDFLETDAVFRLDSFSLSTPSLTEVNRLVKLFEDTDPETVNLANESPDTVCGVLRKWLRSLPEPLFSYEQYDVWIALQQNAATVDDLPGEIQNIMFQLHPTHYLVLQRVFRFLHKLSLYGSVNRMTATVIGFNWQPCLIWSQASAAGLDAAKMGTDNNLTGAIVTTMIENYAKLFLEDSTWVPPDDVQAAASHGVVVSPVPHHQLNSQQQQQQQQQQQAGGGNSTMSTGTPVLSSGISTSNASISRSDDDEQSTESPIVGSTPPSAFGAHAFSAAVGNSGAPSSLPGSLSQSSSPLHSAPPPSMPTPIHPLPPSALSASNGSPTATPPGSQGLPPLLIPNTTTGYPNSSSSASVSMPVTPITPLVAPSQAPPLARSFAGPGGPNSLPGAGGNFRHSQAPSASSASESAGPASPRHSMGPSSTSGGSSGTTPSTPSATGIRKKQPVLVNGYTQATTLCDFSDMTDGMLQFFKNEHIYITNKHDDGWWEGWKRGRRGFFPASFVVEIAI